MHRNALSGFGDTIGQFQRRLFSYGRNTMTLDNEMNSSEKALIVFFRLTMGWTFLWAGIHHFGDDKFVVGFLSHVKTFQDDGSGWKDTMQDSIERVEENIRELSKLIYKYEAARFER
jgi:hypothetical protein